MMDVIYCIYISIVLIPDVTYLLRLDCYVIVMDV